VAKPEDLGRYRLKRLLGRGALGEVWEAADIAHEGAKVAVKIMHAADEELALARSHFAREAVLASHLNHPHVALVRDSGEAAGTSFLVMEMVEGRSLRAVLAENGTPDDVPALAKKLDWLRQIAAGLAAMHDAGLPHRDVKPENVIIRADGSACLVDLGIAKWTRFDLGFVLDPLAAIESAPEPPASSPYVPPETADRSLYDELGDQYAWGVLAHELLTGAVPGDDSPPLTKDRRLPRKISSAIDRARLASRDERWTGMSLLARQIVYEPGELEAAAELPSSDVAKSAAPERTPVFRAEEGSPSGGMGVMIGVAVVFIALLVAILLALR
jgi:serine/threonine protein kinase